MRMNTGPLGHAETGLVIQSAIEGLDSQQILARDLLINRCSLGAETATAYVKEIGVTQSSILKEVLACAENPLTAWQEFCTQMHRAYLERKVF